MAFARSRAGGAVSSGRGNSPAEHLAWFHLGLIRSGGHRTKGGYGVDHGRGEAQEAAAAA